MRRSDTLFQLIKSLSRAEKRNFKLLTQLTSVTSGDKKYLQIFDAIDRQEDYDEEKIIRQFKNDSIIKQFSVAKNYLYNSILRSLSYFYKGSDAELSSLALQVKILVEKNLFPHAQKLLRKAIQKSSEQENFHELLQMLQLEREIMQDMQDFKRFGFFINEIKESERETVAQLSNFLAYQHLYDRVFQIVTANHEAREKNEIAIFNEVLADPLMRDISMCKSHKARVIYWSILWNYNRFRGDFEKCRECAHHWVDTFQQCPTLKISMSRAFISGLYNQSIAHFVLKDFEEGFRTLEFLKNIETRSEKEQLSIFEKYSIITLVHRINTGDVDKSMEIVVDLEEKLAEFQGKIRKASEMTLIFYASVACLMARDLSGSLKWINRFLNEQRTEVRADLQCTARLFNLILHYELGNFDLIDHNLKSTYRFIYKRERMYGIEKTVLNYVRKLISTADNEEKLILFHELKIKLDKLSRDPFESAVYFLLDIDSWVKSKIENKPISQIKKEKLALLEKERGKSLSNE